MRRGLAVGWVVVVIAACDPSGPASDGGTDAYVVDAGPPPRTDQLDLLFMVDNSGSMTEEQATLVRELPRIVTLLGTGHDASGALPDFAPIHSLHMAVVTSDMGTDDIVLSSCPGGLGDDGVMRAHARHPSLGCDTDFDSAVFAFDPSAADAVAHATDVGCLVFDNDGCGFEQQLEAPLKALSLTARADGTSPVPWTRPGYAPPVFRHGELGHGDDPATNGAFLRPDSVLAIVLLSDEDDCATPESRLYSPDDPEFVAIDLNLRCHTFASRLFPLSRYVDGFVGLRSDPRRLVFGVIAGVPPELSGEDASVILANPLMQETIDPASSSGNRLLPTCSTGNGNAYPAIRLTTVAGDLAALGAHATVQSICNASFTPAVNDIVRQMVDALGPPS